MSQLRRSARLHGNGPGPPAQNESSSIEPSQDTLVATPETLVDRESSSEESSEGNESFRYYRDRLKPKRGPRRLKAANQRVQTTRTSRGPPNGSLTTGSSDAETFLQNLSDGITFEHSPSIPVDADLHTSSRSIQRVELIDTAPQGSPSHHGGQFPCPIEECPRGFVYGNEQALIHHLNNHHRDYPINHNISSFARCNVQGCGFFCRLRGIAQHRSSAHPAAPRAAPPAAPPSPDPAITPQSHMQNQVDVSDEQLRAFYTQPLVWIHAEWLDPIYTCWDALLSDMTARAHSVQYEGTLALFLLPGIIRRHQQYLHAKKGGRGRGSPEMPTVIDLLRSFTARLPARAQPRSLILKHARALYDAFPQEPPRPSMPKEPATVIRRQVNKINYLCSQGKLSKAARETRVLQSAYDASFNPETGPWIPPQHPRLEQHIAELFPPGRPEDELGPAPAEGEYPPLQLTEEVVARLLKTRKIDRSEGVSGCSNALLVALATKGSEEQIKSFCSKVCGVFNLLLTGDASPRVHALWMAARVALIDRTDGSGRKRAIGIGEVLYRVFGSACVATDGKELADKLGPTQLAVGISGGVEIAAICTDLGGHDTAIKNDDMVNAYLSIYRRCVEAGLCKYWSRMVRFFRWAYGRPVELRNHLGASVGELSSGVFIGDGLGTSFFSIGIHDFYLEIAQRLREVEDSLSISAERRGFLSCIADDLNIKGTTEVIMKVEPLISPILERCGLRSNLSKSFILGPGVPSALNQPPGVPCVKEGRSTLGRPLGPIDSQRVQVELAIDKARPPVDALKLIRPHFAFRLLKFCYAREADFLCKVLPAAINLEPFAIFDNNLTGSLREVLGFEWRRNRDYVNTHMIGLPARHGGLGITPVAGLDSLRHRLVAYERVKDFLGKYYPHWVALLEQRYGPMYELADFRDRVELAMEGIEVEDRFQRVVQAARKVSSEMVYEHALRYYQYTRTSRDIPDEVSARLLASMTDIGGRWLNATADPFIVGSPAAVDQEFCEAVRARLFAPFSGNGESEVVCDCKGRNEEAVDLNSMHSHPEGCCKNANIFTARHDAVTKCLAQLIKKGGPLGIKVTLEPQVAAGNRQPDIKVERNGVVTYIDVVVASPVSEAAIGSGSAERVGVAAELAEQRKRRDYEGGSFEVIPFAVESYGRFGEQATRYLNALAPRVSPNVMWKFQRDCSHILAFHLGRAHLMCRQRSKVVTEGENAGEEPPD